MTIVENIQVKTLHSNHASLSDYYTTEATNVGLSEVLVVSKNGAGGYDATKTITKNKPVLVYNPDNGTYSLASTNDFTYSEVDGTWFYQGSEIVVHQPPAGANPPVIPRNPLPDTMSESPAPVPVFITNPEKVVEYVYVETPSSGAAIDNQDGTITVYI